MAKRTTMKVSASLVVLFALVGLSKASVCPVATSSECNFDTLRCCDSQFQNFLGLTQCPGSLFDEPQCHGMEIEKMYTNGTTGLFKVCSAFTSFYQCLGVSSSDCTSITYLMKNGMKLSDAMMLMSIYKQFGFACGAGLDTFANTDLCMTSVFSVQADSVQQIRSRFANNLAAQKDLKCSFYKEYTGSMGKLFSNSCGAEAGWWGCEYARLGAMPTLYDCDSRCGATVAYVTGDAASKEKKTTNE